MVAPLLAAALPALIGGVASAAGQFMANNEAKEASGRQMAFQKETLQHQYQWGMEDMRKAGLNPILAYKQGGAGSASGSSYTPGNVGSAGVTGASTAQSSALATRSQDLQLENIAADTALKGAQDKTQTALQMQAMAQAALANTNSGLALAQTENAWWDAALKSEQMSSAKSAAARAKADEELFRNVPILRQFGTAARELNPFLPRTGSP